MDQQAPRTDSEEVARLGEARLVCRTSRKTIFWGFLLASLPCVLGTAVLLFGVKTLLEDWSKDTFGSIILLAVGIFLLWCGRVLWRKANRLRSVQAVVHAGGLSYHDGSTCLTCRWDQVEGVRWVAANHYEESSLAVGGVIPIPGTKTRDLSHTTHQVTVWRKDGVQLVFTDELQHIVELARGIQQETSRNIGGK